MRCWQQRGAESLRNETLLDLPNEQMRNERHPGKRPISEDMSNERATNLGAIPVRQFLLTRITSLIGLGLPGPQATNGFGSGLRASNIL